MQEGRHPSCAQCRHGGDGIPLHVQLTSTYLECASWGGRLSDKQAHDADHQTAPGTQFQSLNGSQASDSGTPQGSNFAVWPIESNGDLADSLKRLTYHATAMIRDRVSAIVDPGAWMTVMGTNVARSLCQASVAAGHTPTQQPISPPIQIAGVGNGVNTCSYRYRGPVALPAPPNEPAHLMEISAAIVDPPGHGLPGLIGMDILRSQKAILDVGGQRLIFPGEGDVTITLPPGSMETPLVVAPSGHLCMLLDDYGNLATGGSIKTPLRSLLRDRTKPTVEAGVTGDAGSTATAVAASACAAKL